jgi:hypothetical protein
MSYNEQMLMQLIKKANMFYKESESSLAPVFTAMHSPRPSQVANLRQAIAAMRPDKKQKYQAALAYIEREYREPRWAFRNRQLQADCGGA